MEELLRFDLVALQNSNEELKYELLYGIFIRSFFFLKKFSNLRQTIDALNTKIAADSAQNSDLNKTNQIKVIFHDDFLCVDKTNDACKLFM